MKSIHNFSDLRPYGINALTGEACRVGRRILCDLTPRGRKIVCDLLGLGPAATSDEVRVFNDNWNSGSKYSVMIPYTLFEDLAVWCLLDSGCTEIRVVQGGEGQGCRWDGGVHGLENDEEIAEFEAVYNDEYSKAIGRTFARINVKNHPGQGTRCEHAMSGRTT